MAGDVEHMDTDRQVTDEQLRVATECAAFSIAGKIGFGEVVARLMKVGFERYHADYSRMETTYYTVEETSCVVPMTEIEKAMRVFSAALVESAVEESQQGKITYPQFTERVRAAGCVGYFVQMTGGCVQYFGHNGEIHTEWFPGRPRP